MKPEEALKILIDKLIPSGYEGIISQVPEILEGLEEPLRINFAFYIYDSWKESDQQKNPILSWATNFLIDKVRANKEDIIKTVEE